MENNALNWPKLENCAHSLLGISANDVKGSLHIIITDAVFDSWLKKPRGEVHFYVNYLLLNANFKHKMVSKPVSTISIWPKKGNS